VLKKETIEKLAAYCKGPEYPAFLKKLIVQGLIKIEEPIVEIQARAEDKAIVSRVLPEAVNEFKSLMTAAGHTVNPKVTVSENVIPSKAW
jgi:vacuolar-type H+-ATPase subunit E/Vma4